MDKGQRALTSFMSQGEYWKRGDGTVVPVERLEADECRRVMEMMEEVLARLWPQAQIVDESVGRLGGELLEALEIYGDEKGRRESVEEILAARLTTRYDSPRELLEAQPLYRALQAQLERTQRLE